MKNRKNQKPKLPPVNQEPPLKGYLSLNRKHPKCLAEGCGRVIEDPISGIFVVHAHETAAFCSAACLARTVLQGEHQELIRQHVGKRDLLAELGYSGILISGRPSFTPERARERAVRSGSLALKYRTRPGRHAGERSPGPDDPPAPLRLRHPATPARRLGGKQGAAVPECRSDHRIPSRGQVLEQLGREISP